MGESQKDPWDKLQAVASMISGIAIPVVVVLLGQQAADLGVAIEKSTEERQTAASEALARVAQANVIPPLIDGLLSQDLMRRKLAMAAILIALPEEGPKLVRELSQSTENQEEKVYASAVLKDRKRKLVDDLSASEEGTRKQAARALINGWQNDAELPKAIIEQSKDESADGVYNSVAVLQALPTASLKANKANLESFLSKAEAQGPRTAAQAAKVRAKLAAPAE